MPLYGKSTGGRRRFAEMRCGSAPQELPTLVELEFALQGERYRFSRSQYTHINRNTKAPELRESHQCFRLEGEDWALLESKSDSAVSRRAEELLHLTCEQFSQVIVLPQGEFLRLLRASSSDKGEMLKTLFSAGGVAAGDGPLPPAGAPAGGQSPPNRRPAGLPAPAGGGGEPGRPGGKSRVPGPAGDRPAPGEQDPGPAAGTGREAAAKPGAVHPAGGGRPGGWQIPGPGPGRLEGAGGAGNPAPAQAGTGPGTAAAGGGPAQESARLGEQKEELLRAQAAGKQAAATRKQLEEQRQSLAALGQQRETLSQRMEKGNAFCKACEEAAARLPALLERRQALEKLSAAWEELARRKARQAAALEGLSIAEQAAAQKQLLLETVSQRLERQEALLRQNAALQLAHTLEPGKPCPVCGALEHPSPAAGQETLLEPRSWNPCAKRRKPPARPR